ncbi:hypothetical protein LXL04_029460 [Taraxacum kok-saghyz]
MEDWPLLLAPKMDQNNGVMFNFVEDKELLVKTDEEAGRIALGDTWISPEDFVVSWGPLLRDLSRINNSGFKKSESLVETIKQQIANGEMKEATKSWGDLEEVIMTSSNDVDFYNFLMDSVENNVSSTAGGAILSRKMATKRYSRIQTYFSRYSPSTQFFRPQFPRIQTYPEPC